MDNRGLEPSVVANELSKTYQLGELLRMEATLRALVRRRSERSVFEALRGVSFEAHQAECFGIVGTNGPGSRRCCRSWPESPVRRADRSPSAAPSCRCWRSRSGFTWSSTGRENSFLYGTILGLERRRDREQARDIAVFAELEHYFDTPLKRYSHGMQSRLCFAIAMLFPANIYCFDEVLAMVDGEFRSRCVAEVTSLVAAGVDGVLREP